MIQGKRLKPDQSAHGNEARLAGLVVTFTLVLSLLAAPLFG